MRWVSHTSTAGPVSTEPKEKKVDVFTHSWNRRCPSSCSNRTKWKQEVALPRGQPPEEVHGDRQWKEGPGEQLTQGRDHDAGECAHQKKTQVLG